MSNSELHVNESFLKYLFDTAFLVEHLCSPCEELITKLQNIFNYFKENQNFNFETYRKNLITVFLQKFENWETLPDFLDLLNFIIKLNIQLLLFGEHLQCREWPWNGLVFTYCLPCWLYKELEDKIQYHCFQRNYIKVGALFYRRL